MACKKNCSCNKNIPICKKPECKCQKSEVYKWCDKDEPCNKNTCESEQIDAKEVFYKLKDSCFSNLDHLDIPKGADLEYILERFGFFIENFSYFDITPNIYNATDFRTFMDALMLDIQLIRNCCENKQQQINSLIQEINLIKNRLTVIEYPQIVDTRGLGFTINSSLPQIIQTLSNKP